MTKKDLDILLDKAIFSPSRAQKYSLSKKRAYHYKAKSAPKRRSNKPLKKE